MGSGKKIPDFRHTSLTDHEYLNGNVFITVVSGFTFMYMAYTLVRSQQPGAEQDLAFGLVSSVILNCLMALLLGFLIFSAFKRPTPPPNIRRYRLIVAVIGLIVILIPSAFGS